MKVHKSGVLLAVLAARRARDAAAATTTAGTARSTRRASPSDACPDAVNEDNGCIYLGQISDLTAGPFAPLGVPITDAQKAFWQRVNEDGGIGGYDIDVNEYVTRQPLQPRDAQAGLQRDRGRRAGARPDPRARPRPLAILG